jgi:hypothetical protein
MTRVIFVVLLGTVWAWPMGSWAVDRSPKEPPRKGKGNDDTNEMPRIPFANWVTLAKSRSPTARRAAARILANYPRRGMPTLLKLLRDPNARVRLKPCGPLKRWSPA